MPTVDRKGRRELQPSEALGQAWRAWGVQLALASLGLILAWVVVSYQAAGSGAAQAGAGSSYSDTETGGRWLAGAVMVGVSLAWLVLLGGVVLLLRSYCFQAIWDGRSVEPGSYLKGMYQVWGVLVVGILLAAWGALLMQAVLPGVLIALAAWLLLVLSRPNAKALGA